MMRAVLGIACARLIQVDRAFDHFERAVEMEPDPFGPHCALGELDLRPCSVDTAADRLSAFRA